MSVLKRFFHTTSYTDRMHPILTKKNRWLWNTLANELYHDHPELWSWIEKKLREYETL